MKNGEWPFTKDGTTGNPKSKDPIRVKRTPSPKGLGMHPPAAPGFASAKYKLDKQAALFKTIVAVDDRTNFCWEPSIFTVYGDGKKLFESGKIAHNHARTQECTVNVTGVDVLELRVRSPGHNAGMHAVWVEPRVLQRTDTEDVPWPFTKKLFSTGPRDYLSDLPEQVVRLGPWSFGKNGDNGNGQEISINKVKSPKGLGMHAPERGEAVVCYKLEKKASVFKGAVGINDTKFIVQGDVVCEVYGDGKRLWQSGHFNRDRSGPEDFTVDVMGVNELELRVVTRNGNHDMHMVWIEPRLLQLNNTPDK